MDVDFSFLQALWFVLIAVLWVGYFVLEGFDFGVGMLLRKLGHTTSDRRAIIHSIGPVWDGNEVWLIVAGGATFAAFPFWYATLFSGFYLALFLILVGLDRARGVVRVLGQVGRPALARRVGVGDGRVELPGLAAVGRGVGEHRPRRPDRRRSGVHRHAVHAAQPVRAARRGDDGAAVPVARGDLPEPAHGRRPARTRPRGRALGLPRRRRGRGRVPGLDGDRRRGRRRARDRARGDRRVAADHLGDIRAGPPAGARLRAERRRDRRAVHDVVRRPVPAGHAVVDERRRGTSRSRTRRRRTTR